MASLLTAQHGVFSRAQAVGAGATKGVIQRRLKDGRWEQIFPDAFRIAGPPLLWQQRLLGACLSLGQTAVVSHEAAAALWAFPEFDRSSVEITIIRGRTHRRLAGVVVHQVRAFRQADRTIVGGIPCTAVARTLIDIASIVSKDKVEEVLDEALRRRLVTIPRLRWKLEEHARSGRAGVAALRALLDMRDPSVAVPESVLETRILRVLRGSDLPTPVAQHAIREQGRLIARVDFAYPDRLVAIEADGYRWHSGHPRWQSDLRRRNVLTTLGWRVIHVTWNDVVHRPDAFLRLVRSTLAAACE